MFSNSEYVYEVYKERSFSKAARNLYISQPALSVTIKRIESRIGAPIFDRSTNPICLTECGQKYIEVVKQMMDLQNGFVNYLHDLKDLKTGYLNVGGSNLFTSCILPPIIAEFTRRFPTVEVNVVEANTPLLNQKLMNGSLDLVVDNFVFDSETHTSTLYRVENLLLAVPSSFEINNKITDYQLTTQDVLSKRFLDADISPVPFDMFADQPFIMLKPGNDTRDRALELFAKYQFRPNVVLNLDQLMTAYNVSCSGMGISFVTDTLINNTLHNPNIVLYKLDPEFASRALCFFHKNGKYVTRAMEEFLHIAQEMANKLY